MNAQATIDRLPVSDAMAQLGLSRTGFYRRLAQAGVRPLQISGRSFLTAEHLEALAELGRWIDAGQDPEAWPGRLDGAAPAGGALAPSSAPRAGVLVQQADAEPDRQAPAELVLAEIETLERLLGFLEKAAAQGWLLPTTTVELLIGARPRGAGFSRYGFSFSAAGAHGRETAWAVSAQPRA
jgi:hypothetical protein